MKTKIKRHYRSVVSVLLSVCMLVSCMTVGLIATDAAKVTGNANEETVGAKVEDSSKVGQTSDIIFKYWKDGEAAKEVSITNKNVAGTFTVSAGDYYFGVDNKNEWLYNTGNGTNLNNGTAIGNVSGYSQNFWVKKKGNNESEMDNHYATFSAGTYTVLWNQSDSNGLQINIALKPNDISLSVGSIAGAEAIVKVGTTTLEEGDTKTVGAGVSGTITVTPDDEHQKATKWYYEGESGTKYDLSPDGKGNYVASFTTPTSNKKILFDALEDKPQYYVTTALNPSSVSSNGASADVGGDVYKLVYEGDVVTLNVTDATSGNYRFKNWDKGTTPNKFTTTYVVNASDASGTQNVSGTDYSKITATANFVDITDTIDLYLDIKGATPSWSVPPYVHVWNSANAGTDIIAPTAMTAYKGTVYKISGVDPRCDKIEFYDATNKTATQTGGLTIPSAAFADHSKKYVYRLRSKSWSDNADSTATNHYTATADATSITNNPDVYSDIKATFFDYYTDMEFNKQNDGNDPNWMNIDKRYAMLGDPYYHEIYTHLNKALSDYAGYSATSVAFPLYFGDFYKRSDGYQGANSNSVPSGETSNGYKLNSNGVVDSTKTNFYIKVNRNLNGVNNSDDHTALTGLTGKSLEDGIIHYYKSGATNENGAPMVLFDEDWLTETSKNGQGELATIIDSPFPVRVTKKFSPSKIYLDVGTWGSWPDHHKTTYRAKFYNGETLISTVDLSEVSEKFYSGDIPANATKVKFCRYADSAEYNHTDELEIPKEKKKYKVGTGWQDYSDAEGNNYNYYGFNSTDGADNAWFEGLKTSNTTIHYAKDDKLHTAGGHEYEASNSSTKGFFPFEAGVTGDRDNTSNKAHDLGFGVKLEFDFTLGEGGKLYGQDQIFEYSGDDDLWVFVDDKLLLDLGGDHFQSSGKINFATKTIDASNVLAVDGKTRNTFDSAFPDGFDNNDTTKIHTMTIYYMERGMFDSNLKFGFSISPVGNQFVNEKKVSVENVNEALKSEVEAYSAADKFDYTLKQSAHEGTINTGVTPHTDSMAANETYSPVDGKSYKLDPENTAGESLTTTSAGGFTLKPDQTATFLNQLSVQHYIQLTETPNAANNNKYVYDPDVLVYDITNGNEISLTGSGDTAGYFFYATKFRTGTVSDIDPTKVRALWTNEVQTRDVTITKTVPDGVVNNPNFTFTVLLKLPGSSDFYPYELECTVGSGGVTVPDTLDVLGQIRIKKGKTVTLTGIPVGTEIRISEDSIPNPFRLTNKTVTGTNTRDTAVTGHPERVDFTVDGSTGNVAANFTNNINTQQVIVKKVVTNSNDTTTAFPITVKIKSEGAAGSYDTTIKYKKSSAVDPDAQITYSGDTLSETLAANAYLTFSLPVGAYVEVAETDFSSQSGFANFDYSQATAVTYKDDDSTGYTGAFNSGAATNFTLESGKDAHVIVTNVGKGYDVTIKKKLVSGTSAKLYTVNVKAGEAAYSGEYEIYDKNGTQITTRTMTNGAVDLGVDEYVVLKAVAENTALKVTEKELSSTYVRAFHYGYTSVKVGSGSTLTTQDEGGITTASTNPKKIDNGVSLTVTAATSVEVYNKPWTYYISYNYPAYLARYHGKTAPQQFYVKSGAFTDADFEATTGLLTIDSINDSNGNPRPCPVFKDMTHTYAEIKDGLSSFITTKAPYEDNFMSTLTWNPIFATSGSVVQNTTFSYKPLSKNANVEIKTNADERPNKTVYAYFRLPYDHQSWDKIGGKRLDPMATDGKVLKKAWVNYRVETQYGTWVTLNDATTKSEAQWVEAAPEIYGSDGKTYVFDYWQMTSIGYNENFVDVDEHTKPERLHELKLEIPYKRCYNLAFNMTMYQDSYVEAVYVEKSDPRANMTQQQKEAADTNQVSNGAVINFLENSRNQWNNNGGTLYGTNYEKIASRVEKGDRIFSDFLLSFHMDNDITLAGDLSKTVKEQAKDELGSLVFDDEGHPVMVDVSYPILKGGTATVNYQIGVVIERVDELSKNAEEKYYVESQATYKAKYDTTESLETQKDNVKTYLTAGTNPSSKYLKDEFSAKALDNKNEMEYSYSLPVNNFNNRQNYVYRAFAYLKDYTIDQSATYTYNGISIAAADLGNHTGAILKVSDPVYFTIYDMASIKDGETYSGGGQS